MDILALRVMELFTPQGVNDNNPLTTNYVTQSRSLAAPHPQSNANSTLSDGFLFDRWLIQSSHRIVDHCEASSVGSSSLTCNIGVDTTNLKDHVVYSRDTSTVTDSQGTREAPKPKSD